MELLLPLHQDKPRELVLIELQGALDCDDGVYSGQQLGKFTYANASDSGNPELVIGNHRLEGKLVKMGKPFAVLEKRQLAPPASATDSADYMEVDSVGGEERGQGRGRGQEQGASTTEWRVRGIVKYKYMFKTRPQNLV